MAAARSFLGPKNEDRGKFSGRRDDGDKVLNFESFVEKVSKF